jgi:acetyl-CoA carboxylase carboxyltransferase component
MLSVLQTALTLGKSTSSQTMNESLPPSSRVTGMRVSDALCMICDKNRTEDFRTEEMIKGRNTLNNMHRAIQFKTEYYILNDTGYITPKTNRGTLPCR